MKYTDTATTGISIQSAGAHIRSVDIAPFISGYTGAVAGTNAPYIRLLACHKS